MVRGGQVLADGALPDCLKEPRHHGDGVVPSAHITARGDRTERETKVSDDVNRSVSTATGETAKPSDFPRDPRFRVPGPTFIEDGVAHVRSYRDVRRVMVEASEAEISRDVSFWMNPDERVHATWSFVWGTARRRADGSPGRYDRLRGLIEPFFRKHALAALETAVRDHAAGLTRAIVEKGTGEVNLATELAYPLALRTNCSLVGFPAEHHDWLSEQLFTIIRAPRGGLGDREPQEVEAYIWELVRRREASPGETMLDLIIAAWRSGDITDIELLGHVWSLSQSAVEDAGTNTANAFALLAEFGHLEEASSKIDDESWLYWAGEEVLRFGAPFPARPVATTRDIVLDGGVHVPARTQVRLWLSAANRDPAINGDNANARDPLVFDVTRSPNRHLAFGVGRRMCMAAPLARMQARVALRMVLRHLPGLELDTTRPFERHAGITDGVLQAHFRFDQGQASRLLATAETLRRSRVTAEGM